jgi:hypothetical protein
MRRSEQGAADMGMKRWGIVSDLLVRADLRGQASQRPKGRAPIDIGFELSPHGKRPEPLEPQPLALSEVAVVSFLEGTSPYALPLSVADAAHLEGELASLRKLDPLEAFALCHEWILTQGSFRGLLSESDRGCDVSGDCCCELGSQRGAYAS